MKLTFVLALLIALANADEGSQKLVDVVAGLIALMASGTTCVALAAVTAEEAGRVMTTRLVRLRKITSKAPKRRRQFSFRSEVVLKSGCVPNQSAAAIVSLLESAY